MRGGGHRSEWNSKVGHEQKKVENHCIRVQSIPSQVTAFFWVTVVRTYTITEVRNLIIKVNEILSNFELCAKDIDCGKLRCFGVNFNIFIKMAINWTN
jgi:hypothetical protein